VGYEQVGGTAMDERGFGAVPLPPPPTGTAEGRARLEGLAEKRQMLIVAAILNGVAGAIARVATFPRSVVLLAAVAISVFLIVAAVRIANQLFGVGAAIGSAIAMLIPLVWIGVVVLLCVKASRRLKAGVGNGPAVPPSRF
jgi:hypothetical protein